MTPAGGTAGIALMRGVPPTLSDCELTFHERRPIDLALAVAQHAAYGDLLRSLDLEVVELPADPDAPERKKMFQHMNNLTIPLVMDDTDKVRSFRDDALAQGLAVLPPDVNASNYRFEPVDPLPADVRSDGGRAEADVEPADVLSFRQWGRPVRVRAIRGL